MRCDWKAVAHSLLRKCVLACQLAHTCPMAWLAQNFLARLLEQLDPRKKRGCKVTAVWNLGRWGRGGIPDASFEETCCIRFSTHRTASNNWGFLVCCSFMERLKIKLTLLLIYPEMVSACHFFDQKTLRIIKILSLNSGPIKMPH